MQEAGGSTSPIAKPLPLWRFWLTRILAGFAFAVFCYFVLHVAWLGLLVAIYGSLDIALKSMGASVGVAVGSAAYFASMPASFVGGFVAPLVLGTSTRRRRAVALSSLAGAAIAATSALVYGGLAGWIGWQVEPRSMTFAWIALALSVPAGIAGGWVGGSVVRQISKRV